MLTHMEGHLLCLHIILGQSGYRKKIFTFCNMVNVLITELLNPLLFVSEGETKA